MNIVDAKGRSSRRLAWSAAPAVSLVIAVGIIGYAWHLRWLTLSSNCHGRIYSAGTYLQALVQWHEASPVSDAVSTGDRPMHSWRVFILEGRDPAVFHKYRLCEPWNSTHNIQLESRASMYFQCPNVQRRSNSRHTSFVAITGPKAVLQLTGDRPRLYVHPDSSEFDAFWKVNSDVIMLVETPRTDIHWMSPVDFNYEVLAALSPAELKEWIGSPDQGGGRVILANGRSATIASIGWENLLDRMQVREWETPEKTDNRAGRTGALNR